MNPKSLFLDFIKNESAHMSLAEAVADFPLDHINDKAPRVQYSFWHILEHIRITQQDLILYPQDPKYVSPQWPEGYWPNPEEKTDKKGWEKTLNTIVKDWNEFVEVLKQPSTDIFAPVPFADNKTLFRCATLILEHNSYHLGEFGLLRQTLNLWGKNRDS